MDKYEQDSTAESECLKMFEGNFCVCQFCDRNERLREKYNLGLMVYILDNYHLSVVKIILADLGLSPVGDAKVCAERLASVWSAGDIGKEVSQ